MDKGYLKLPNGPNIPKDGRPMKLIIEELNKPKPGLIQMAQIPKEHFYQGMPQAEPYVQMQAADPEEEASRVLIELMHRTTCDCLPIFTCWDLETLIFWPQIKTIINNDVCQCAIFI